MIIEISWRDFTLLRKRTGVFFKKEETRVLNLEQDFLNRDSLLDFLGMTVLLELPVI